MFPEEKYSISVMSPPLQKLQVDDEKDAENQGNCMIIIHFYCIFGPQK